jgi:hypothetical protein
VTSHHVPAPEKINLLVMFAEQPPRSRSVRKGPTCVVDPARQSLDEIGPLQRFDVVYVTRKPIADQNLFMKQWIRNALPIDFFLVYDIGRD